MADQIEDIKKKIFSTFGEVAGSIGYSPLHGQIIGALIVNDKPLSLQELARETGYSASMISLSLDLLEIVGIIKKFRQPNDRQLYIKLTGDLLESLKKAIVMKVEKSIKYSLKEFEDSKKRLSELEGRDKEKVIKTIDILENNMKRLDKYVDMLSKIKLQP